MTRSAWTRACELTALLGFSVVIAHVATATLGGPSLVYAGGAAVVLGVGATVGAFLRRGEHRVALAVALVGLLTLRLAGPLFPRVLHVDEGPLSSLDAVVLGALLLSSVVLALHAGAHGRVGDDDARG